jgi:hypothetical protein
MADEYGSYIPQHIRQTEAFHFADGTEVDYERLRSAINLVAKIGSFAWSLGSLYLRGEPTTLGRRGYR